MNTENADNPPPSAPPVPEVVYTPEEAVAWIRTMTPGALVKAANRDPKRFPSTKPGRDIGFSGKDIVAIVAASGRVPEETPAAPAPSRRGRRTSSGLSIAPSGAPLLKADPGRARRRKAS
jgi:hypothetical protein